MVDFGLICAYNFDCFACCFVCWALWFLLGLCLRCGSRLFIFGYCLGCGLCLILVNWFCFVSCALRVWVFFFVLVVWVFVVCV